MRRTILKSLSFLLAFIVLAVQTQSLSGRTINANTPSIEESAFILNQNELDLVFAELNELDNYLTSNEGLTYADLQAEGSTLIANISDITAPLGQTQEGEAPLGIPAFWWGCILGWVGLLIVYVVTDKDQVQTKKALNGCLISSGVNVLIVIIYYVWLASEVNSII